MAKAHNTVAFIYDFDGTLARGNIQEQSFIPKEVGMGKEAFWESVRAKSQSEDSDQILTYMYMMLVGPKGAHRPVTKESLIAHGRTAKLFPGLENGDWFRRMASFSGDLGLTVEHYIISSGIFEMIEGCPIYDYFRHVFASKFLYDETGQAVWPAVSINYTTKTQYIFRINKGAINQWDDNKINAYMPEDDRPVPFSRMIYFGDGATDIPTMKMMTYKGGYSIAVYDPEAGKSDRSQIHRLLADDRVNFVAPADYRPDTQLDIIVKGLLGRMQHRLRDA